MADQQTRGKPKYESPVLTFLGELARGSGDCAVGSSVGSSACFPGAVDGGGSGGGGITDCTAGYTATQDCTAGPTATRDCTAGTSANRACTAGTAVA